MKNWLLLPGILMIGTFLLLTALATFAARRWLRPETLKRYHDVAGPIYTTVGVLYAVLLAFVVVVVWQAYTSIDAEVEQEAGALTNVYRDAEVFPEPFKSQLREGVYGYTLSVIHSELDSLAAGTTSSESERALNHLWTIYGRFEPNTANDVAWYSEILGRLNKIAEYRQMRLHAAHTGLPLLLWIVLWIGALITIGFSLLFGVQELRVHAAIIFGQAAMIAVVMFLVWALELPLGGFVHVGPGAYRDAVTAMDHMNADQP